MKEKVIDPTLKDPDILKKKPELKICSNHRKKERGRIYKFWDSGKQGTAVRDGNGWYKEKE